MKISKTCSLLNVMAPFVISGSILSAGEYPLIENSSHIFKARLEVKDKYFKSNSNIPYKIKMEFAILTSYKQKLEGKSIIFNYYLTNDGLLFGDFQQLLKLDGKELIIYVEIIDELPVIKIWERFSNDRESLIIRTLQNDSRSKHN